MADSGAGQVPGATDISPAGLDKTFHHYMTRLGKKNPALIDHAQRSVNAVATLMRTH